MKAKILGLLAAALLAGPMTANALIISIAGQGAADGQWDVTTIFGDASNAAFVDVLDNQIWWANRPLANAFATAVGGSFGYPNLSGLLGPFFAETANQGAAWALGGTLSGYRGSENTGSYTYAIASRVPEPGSLALLGLGLLGVGVSRRKA